MVTQKPFMMEDETYELTLLTELKFYWRMFIDILKKEQL